MSQEQMQQEATHTTPCRCPVRPYYSLGSFGSGSRHEDVLVKQWTLEHGHHAYALARDGLATALQYAQGSVTRGEQEKSGDAVLDMVHDVFGLERPSKAV